jgi:hypothetical protein
MYSGYMASISWGFHDFVKVADCELRRMGFKGGEAVSEDGCGAVEGCAEEVTHRGDGGAECPADLALEGVELGVAEKTALESQVLAKKESADGADSAGLCEL